MSTDITAALAKIDSPTLANAIEKLEVRNRLTGFCNRSIRHLIPELGVLCAYAVTVQAETGVAEPSTRQEGVESYLEVCRALEKSPKPAVVVFQEFGPLPEFSAHIGEVLATMFQQFGAVGVISDSAVRDVAELRQLRFQAFAPGTVASHANFIIRHVQVPVMVCGLPIYPGDLLHGDENGLLKVPEQGRDKLPELAAKVAADERIALDYMKSAAMTIEGIGEKLTH